MSADPKNLAALIYSEFGMEHDQARRIAEFVAAAGWVSPEALHAEVERLTNSVGAFSSARDAAKRGWQGVKDKVDRVEALAEKLESHSETEWAATSIRAALAEPERDEESAAKIDCVEEMANVIWSKGGAGLLMYDALRIAEVLIAAGYERLSDEEGGR